MTTLKKILEDFDKKFPSPTQMPSGNDWNEKQVGEEIKQFIVSSIKQALEEVEVEENNDGDYSESGWNQCNAKFRQKRRKFLKS